MHSKTETLAKWRLILVAIPCAVSLLNVLPALAEKEGPVLNRTDLSFRQQTVQAAFTTLKYKMMELDARYKNRAINEAQYSVENLKLRLEEQKLRLRDCKLRVDDAKLRVKEGQEYVLKCMEAQTEQQQKVMALETELKETMAVK